MVRWGGVGLGRVRCGKDHKLQGETKMKQISIEVEGTAPLLMHSAENMEEQKGTKNPAKNYDPKIDAEKVVYKNDKGELFVPSRCLKASLLNASSWYKFGKKSAKPIIAGCTRIEPYEIILLNKDNKPIKEYVIDKRPVVIQRSRIIRARPRIDKWKLKFELVYDERVVGSSVDIIQNCLEEAGLRIGILDNRPQKYGENGTFKVTKFLPKQ